MEYWQINSLLVCRNTKTGTNSYFEMPFKKECRVTLENLNPEDKGVGYQIDYELRDIPDDALYFHAQFYRINPLPYKQDYTILDKQKKNNGCPGSVVHGKIQFTDTVTVTVPKL